VGIVGDAAGGRDGATRPFGCRAVMIAHACVRGHFGATGLADQRRMALPAFNVRGTRSSRERGSPRSINRGKGKGESLTSPLSIHCFRFSPSFRPCAPPIYLSFASFSVRCLPAFCSRLQWLRLSQL
jgi:hypothetical protein